MTADLVAFLRARLDEDERIAKATTPVPVPGRWRMAQDKHAPGDAPVSLIQGQDDEPPEYRGYGYNVPVIVSAILWAGEVSPDLEHIARHDPARVLAQVAAMRAVVDANVREQESLRKRWSYGPLDGEVADELIADQVRLLRLLAAVWSDHEDYRVEWAEAT